MKTLKNKVKNFTEQELKIRRAVGGNLLEWLKVSRGLLGERGTENNPLCKLYFNKGFGCVRCEHCPIKNKTGRTKCDGTPYEKWIEHHHVAHKQWDIGTKGYVVQCSECKEIARDMFYFILDIIEDR